MKIGHWSQFNHSGMNRVAESMVEAEKRLGLDSVLVNIFKESDWDHLLDCDVHVSHTHFPWTYKGKSIEKQLTKPFRLVWIGHGTPEHVIQSTAIEAQTRRHGIGDGVMLWLHGLQNSHARVTFWERHKWILDKMVDRGTQVDLVPLGVDKEFWSGGTSKGKWPGTPSVWSGENPHFIKWPLDLILAWPYVYSELNGASLHLQYLVEDLHRVLAPIIVRNGAGYGMHWDANIFAHHALRDVLKSVDFFVGLVKYGDFNRLSLEANAAGVAKTISYPGNPYSDYWVTEGDQRSLAADLVRILSGDVAPRDKSIVPDASDMAAAMKAIYERIAP